MKRGKQLLRRVFCLPPLPTVVVAVPSFALVIDVLSHGRNGPLAYAAYLASAYALAISITGLPGILRSLRGWMKGRPLIQKLRGIPFVQRLTQDIRFRAGVSLWQGLLMNLLYVALKLASGLYYRSAWFLSLAAYYLLLAVMRLLLLSGQTEDTCGAGSAREWCRYRLCGFGLLAMNFALAGMVSLIVHQNRGYQYPGLLIYAMAAYSFYAVAAAVVSLVRYRRYQSPVLSAARAVGLAAAMVSILSLETAMIARFGGDGDPLFRRIMTSATGGGVCTIVFGMAIWMIVRSAGALRRIEPRKH